MFEGRNSNNRTGIRSLAAPSPLKAICARQWLYLCSSRILTLCLPNDRITATSSIFFDFRTLVRPSSFPLSYLRCLNLPKNLASRIIPQTGQALGVSQSLCQFLFHIALLIALLCWYLPEHSQPIAQAENQAAAANKIQPAKDESNSSIPANPGENVPATEVLASLENAVSQAQRLSDERQLSELEKQLKRLNSISSEESVQETTNKIANTLGLTPGPIPTENSVPGGFDHKTAQIHNVNRIRDEHGNWQYRSILVDAAGRTEEVALPANEGEVTYKTFQQLKQFPWLTAFIVRWSCQCFKTC